MQYAPVECERAGDRLDGGKLNERVPPSDEILRLAANLDVQHRTTGGAEQLLQLELDRLGCLVANVDGARHLVDALTRRLGDETVGGRHGGGAKVANHLLVLLLQLQLLLQQQLRRRRR